MLFWHFFYQRALVFLLALVFVLPLASCSRDNGGDGNAGVATLSWVAPTQREDSSALSLAEIKGYRIYYGEASGVYSEVIIINDPTSTQADLTGALSGTYYVILTTVDSEGRESQPSLEVAVKI